MLNIITSFDSIVERLISFAKTSRTSYGDEIACKVEAAWEDLKGYIKELESGNEDLRNGRAVLADGLLNALDAVPNGQQGADDNKLKVDSVAFIKMGILLRTVEDRALAITHPDMTSKARERLASDILNLVVKITNETTLITNGVPASLSKEELEDMINRAVATRDVIVAETTGKDNNAGDSFVDSFLPNALEKMQQAFDESDAKIAAGDSSPESLETTDNEIKGAVKELDDKWRGQHDAAIEAYERLSREIYEQDPAFAPFRELNRTSR